MEVVGTIECLVLFLKYDLSPCPLQTSIPLWDFLLKEKEIGKKYFRGR